jgi:predicted MFS family arabinose efflux permease
MVAFGFGEVFGGLLHGLLIDKIGSKKAVLVNLIIMILTFSATQYSIYLGEFNVWSFVMCLCWGYADGSNNIFIF